MKEKGMMLKATLILDDEWASNLTEEELIESIRTRLDTSLGFRGRAVKLKVAAKGPKTPSK